MTALWTWLADQWRVVLAACGGLVGLVLLGMNIYHNYRVRRYLMQIEANTRK